MAFKYVALAGATGSLGSVLLNALVSNGNFQITVLRRNDNNALPVGVKSQVVDFDSSNALITAMKGQDVLIDATSTLDARLSIRLMEAAAAAGVKRIIASEFSADPTNVKTRSLPVFKGKAEAHEHLKALAADGRITYTAISNNAFLDWKLRIGLMNIDLANKKVNLMNDGNVKFYWTLLSSVADAVINSLLRSEETKNRICYIFNTYKSQAEMADLAKEALGHEGWQITQTDTEKAFLEASKNWDAGNISFQVIGDMIRYANSTPEYSPKLKTDHNELLGVQELTDFDIRQLMKEIAGELRKA
ncbi:Bifunctional pinoresinol-lariciresinol reductase [Colletotrichum truncatum]|uniref:Bifunctional pinoresinol-lariciresinol reductase n=1 Tax=Colletotrichum truncatum TaxID=5467 RepID=A0ACC3ZDP9_COLTU|nr:Bifunctional pinoresinol-lariciresinol reductase [Colletotrichum truncatum]KAF6797992.1 Bifunctional pinoresinol-lariciresinol reductase [Colletotrichum truncatum]